MSPVLLLTMVLCHSSKPSWLLVSIYTSYKPVEILFCINFSCPNTSTQSKRISFIQNQLSSSIITLEWDPPSSTGVCQLYPHRLPNTSDLSGSPVTMDTTSTQITISYNTPYNVTIRAENCAGMSQESSIVDL